MKKTMILALLLTRQVLAEKKPNIVWLFCDDMAVNAIGAYESRQPSANNQTKSRTTGTAVSSL